MGGRVPAQSISASRTVFEVVQRRKQGAAAVETDDNEEPEDRAIVGPEMAPAEQEELNQLAEEYQAISFTGL